MSQLKLTPKWCLDAALLSRPVDLTALVTMSKNIPEEFIYDNILYRLITILLNEKNISKSDKDTKLDVLNILANVSIANKSCLEEVRNALSGISEWFDTYMSSEEGDVTKEPELHKAMVLLLARCWEYQLKTEDVLELTQGNRRIALCTVVGLLEDGETYSTELKQRQKPGQGKMGQWEHELVVNRYEKPLLLQVCRLLRGFTHPGTYFESNSRDSKEEIELYNVERFGDEMDTLLEITMRSRFVEKLSIALYDCLLLNEPTDEIKSSSETPSKVEIKGMLEESDHLAVACVHAFLQNLYFYASRNVEEFRLHMLVDTLLIPRLVIPYLDKCMTHALVLNSRAELYSDLLEGDQVAQLILHNPQLVKGITSTLRTLIIASFRAPNTLYVMILLRKLNPTILLLRAATFCKHHEYVFTLLCMLNVNMGALDLRSCKNENKSSTSINTSSPKPTSKSPSAISRFMEESPLEESQNAINLLRDLERIYSQMTKEAQQRILKRVMSSGALPLARDTPSYTAIMSLLLGGIAGQFDYRSLVGSTPKANSITPKASSVSSTPLGGMYKFLTLDTSYGNIVNSPGATAKVLQFDDNMDHTVDKNIEDDLDEEMRHSRAEAKKEYEERMAVSISTTSSMVANRIDNTFKSESTIGYPKGNSSLQDNYDDSLAVAEAKAIVAEAAFVAEQSISIASSHVSTSNHFQSSSGSSQSGSSQSGSISSAYQIAIAVTQAAEEKSNPSSPYNRLKVGNPMGSNTSTYLSTDVANNTFNNLQNNSNNHNNYNENLNNNSPNNIGSGSKYRLLGELPSLLTKQGQDRMNDIKIAMRLELPMEFKKKHDFMNNANGVSSPLITPSRRGQDAKDNGSGFTSTAIGKESIPKDFLCAINGHVMKRPMVTPSGIYFEKETIELWLQTRGSVCPITHKPLTLNDLEPADELRNRIKRYQIQQTAMRTAREGEDDLYDF